MRLCTHTSKRILGALIEACPLNKANMVCRVLKHRLWFLIWLIWLILLLNIWCWTDVFLLARYKKRLWVPTIYVLEQKKYHTIYVLDHTQENITFFASALSFSILKSVIYWTLRANVKISATMQADQCLWCLLHR